MITTDKKCALLERLLISKTSITLKILLEDDDSKYNERWWFENNILLAKIYTIFTEKLGNKFLGRKTYFLIFLAKCKYLEMKNLYKDVFLSK